MQLVKISAAWCGPCKQLQQTLNSIDNDLVKNMKSLDVDVDSKEIRGYNRVSSVPTLLILDDSGVELKRLTGNHPKSKIEEFLKD